MGAVDQQVCVAQLSQGACVYVIPGHSSDSRGGTVQMHMHGGRTRVASRSLRSGRGWHQAATPSLSRVVWGELHHLILVIRMADPGVFMDRWTAALRLVPVHGAKLRTAPAVAPWPYRMRRRPFDLCLPRMPSPTTSGGNVRSMD